MTDFPDLKLKVLVTYPATILGGAGISTVKQANGNIVLNLDYTEFSTLSALPTAPTNYILTYDTLTKLFVLVPTALMGGGGGGGGGGGITDAPTDGVTYGRKNAAWTPVAPADAPSDGTFYGRKNGAWVNPPQECGLALNLGGTNFVFTSSSPTKYKMMLWSGIKFNQGGLWVAQPNLGAAIIPPAGTRIVRLDAAVWILSGFGGNWVAKWIKNATVDGNFFLISGTDVCAGIGSPGPTGTIIIRASGIDVPSPGDYYQLFLYCDGASPGVSAITVDGNPSHTYAYASAVF